MNPGALGFFVWIYGGRECRCGQGFREGNGKLVRQRDVASIRGESRAPEGCGIDSGRKPGARGRGYRPGQGLRRGIQQLRFREMAKSIAAGPELAVGSNS